MVFLATDLRRGGLVSGVCSTLLVSNPSMNPPAIGMIGGISTSLGIKA
jgi:hypothetical protein